MASPCTGHHDALCCPCTVEPGPLQHTSSPLESHCLYLTRVPSTGIVPHRPAHPCLMLAFRSSPPAGMIPLEPDLQEVVPATSNQ